MQAEEESRIRELRKQLFMRTPLLGRLSMHCKARLARSLVPVTWCWAAVFSFNKNKGFMWGNSLSASSYATRCPQVRTLMCATRGGADDGRFGADLFPSDRPDVVKPFVEQGPLYPRCFPPGGAPPPPIVEWVQEGSKLRGSLGIEGSGMSQQAARRIFHLYLPVYFWILSLMRQHRDKGVEGPLVVGLSAPQGSGKTTIVRFLRQLLQGQGLSTVVLSIDDFYLTNAQQKALGARYPSNRLLQVRGNAGTHDVQLGRETIVKCKKAGPGQTVRLPGYDKSRDGGRGDRIEENKWASVDGPLDLVLLEGWMLGFEPLPEGDRLLEVDPGLAQVNAELGKYDAWHREVDAWVVVEAGELQWVYDWRKEAEERMKAEKGPTAGMSEEQVRDFVSRYMPAYEAFLPGLYSGGVARRRGGEDATPLPMLRIKIGKDRSPLP